MSTVAYPIAIGDGLSGGVSTTVTTVSLTDSGVGSDVINSTNQVTIAPLPGVIYGGVNLPLLTPGTVITLTFPTCIPTPYTLSPLSGSVTLYTHCPNEVIQPSLFNDRRAVVYYQTQNLMKLANIACYLYPSYCTDYNNLVSFMNTLSNYPAVSVGDYVSHKHFNLFLQYIQLALGVLEDVINIFYGGYLSNPYGFTSLVLNYMNTIGYPLTRIAPKSSMDMLYSSDWNAITNALVAIDNVLQVIKQYDPIVVTLKNPGYTYPTNQQIPIGLSISSLNIPSVNENLSNIRFLEPGDNPNGQPIYTWIETDANHNNGTAVFWIKCDSNCVNALNNGSVNIVLVPVPSATLDGNYYGISASITGNFSLDNIANVMDAGLIYSDWANTSKSACSAGNPPSNDPLTNAYMAQPSLTFDTACGSFTESLISSLNVVSSLFSGTIPCTSKLTNCNSCSNSPQCTTVNNMLFDLQSNYCCGSGSPVSGYNTWLRKAIGWVQTSQGVALNVLVDDAINTWFALTGELGTDGINWASGGSGIVNSWTAQAIQSSPYTGSIPAGTWRFELHYANVDQSQNALMVWFNNPVNMFHAKYVPPNLMPSVSLTTVL